MNDQNACTEEDLNPIQIPLDHLFFEGDSDLVTELHFNDVEKYNFDLSFDDLDNLYLENAAFASDLDQLPDSHPDHDGKIDPDPSDGYLCNFATELESGSLVVTDDRGCDVSKYLNCSPSESGCCDTGDRSSDSAKVSSSPVSSQRSENVVSGFSGTMNAASPDSGNCVVDQKVKTKDYTAKMEVPKRKDFAADSTGSESRNNKLRRSENGASKTTITTANSDAGNLSEGLSEEEEKRRVRLLRNRESAQLSRQRKKHYMEELEDKVRAMNSTISELNSKISCFMAENVSLRRQLSSSNVSGVCPPPPVYPPMGPVGYPWMIPYPPYVVKPQGSQVPLVPIPKLKPQQQPVAASKPKKVKAKKVASISLLGLLFFVLLIGGLVPMVNIKITGIRESGVSWFTGFGTFNEKIDDQRRGRVLIVNGHKNYSHEDMGVQKKEEFNSSELLVASLFVPRNDKLVKIDGNLIIHSVLASERAMAPHEKPKPNNYEDTALAIPDIGSIGKKHSHSCHGTNERPKVLTTGSADSLKDHFRLSAADGKMQQWFHEGIAGPMLSSGMCTEVFQFDISPASGAIVPASSVINTTTENRRNSTRINKGRSRRALRSHAVPLPKSDLNITAEHAGRNFQQEDLQFNNTASQMIVSVLIDPREAGDGSNGIDDMITPKSLTRIFVVVLMDRVKYVTYSCGLPRTGPHIVTT